MLTVELNGVSMSFQTLPTLFSPKSLDIGTKAMLSFASLSPNDKVLDLGCGYGIVGIYAAKIVGEENVSMADIDESAVVAAKENAKLNGVPNIKVFLSDGFSGIQETGYTIILSNPPYHADFSVAKHFIEKGFNRLAMTGKMVMVTKRKDWYKNKFISIFGGVTVKETDGYYVFIAEKRSMNYASKVHLSG